MARYRAALVALAAGVLAVLAAAAAAAKVETKRASAEILWDDYGVPHIYADNHEVLVRRRPATAMSFALVLWLTLSLSSRLFVHLRTGLRLWLRPGPRPQRRDPAPDRHRAWSRLRVLG